jgi:hypothetical protein
MNKERGRERERERESREEKRRTTERTRAARKKMWFLEIVFLA